MLRIQRTANGEVVFALGGRMDAENVGELITLLGSEVKGRRIVMDLKDYHQRSIRTPSFKGGEKALDVGLLSLL